MLKHYIENQCTKFNFSHFSHKEILGGGGLRILMGHVTITTPLLGQFVIHMLGLLATTNLCAKFDIFIFTHYQGMKGDVL